MRTTDYQINKSQELTKEYVIELAKEAMSEHQSVSISNEELWSFNGVLAFAIHIKANENTGALCIVDKAFFVTIGRKGAIKSRRIVYITSEKETKMRKGFSPYR